MWEHTHLKGNPVLSDGIYPVVGFLNDEAYRLTPPTFISIGDNEAPRRAKGYYPPTDSLLLQNGACIPLGLFPELDHVSDSLDLIWIRCNEFGQYEFPLKTRSMDDPFIQSSREFYFYVLDTVDYSYELHLINGVEDWLLNIGEEQQLWADGDCVYKLIMLHEGVKADSIEFKFKARFTVSTKDESALPSIWQLRAHPNPFNPSTTIEYEIPEKSGVSLSVYDLQGRLVRTLVSESKPAGTYKVHWNGRDESGKQISTGTYLAKLMADNFSSVVKLVYLE